MRGKAQHGHGDGWRFGLLPVLFLLLSSMASGGAGDRGPEAATPADKADDAGLRSEDLDNYEFEAKESSSPVPTVGSLSIGQRYVLERRRGEISDLVARWLGIIRLQGDRRDLETLQHLVDRKLIKRDAVQVWQALGVVFGDMLVKEFDLHWVSYEDDLGISKALRFEDTENYVFPVTLFSKRVQFNEPIKLSTIFEELTVKIEKFKAYERNRVSFD